MSNFKFELNSDGVKQLLKSQEMQSFLKDKANGIAERAKNCKVTVRSGKTRANASVLGNADESNTLLKAVRG